MPKFGWKCFVGSFLFSLAAVFAATKGYVWLSAGQEQNEPVFSDIESKNIELFTQNDDEEIIGEKFAQAETNTGKNSVPPETPQPAATGETSAPDNDMPAADTVVQNNFSAGSDILYAPENDTSEDGDISLTAENTAVSENAAVSAVENSDIETDSQPADNSADGDSGEIMQIADASEAVPFAIPLRHNYGSGSDTVTISHETQNNQIALASKNVKIENLGIDGKPAQISPEPQPFEDNPWEVAATANEHIAKNAFGKFSKEHKDETAALDKSLPAQADNEIKLASKRPDNILIPIPDEIKNNDNLVPDLAYSEENKQLVKKLHLDQPLKKPDEITNTTPVPNSRKSKKDKKNLSLTDSIAAWFSSSDSDKDKISRDEAAASQNESDVSSVSADDENGDESSAKKKLSAFDRLLGLGRNSQKNGIAPSELKLAFQPGRAEISGQTLEWLHAFSANVTANEDVFIEVRINGSSSYGLQQKRLKLLYSIFVNNGVDLNKINIIFTDREPNSFIIRNVRYASEESAARARREAYNPWK